MVKSGLAQMCKGGLIMDVVNAEQAKIAEEAGVSFEQGMAPRIFADRYFPHWPFFRSVKFYF